MCSGVPVCPCPRPSSRAAGVVSHLSPSSQGSDTGKHRGTGPSGPARCARAGTGTPCCHCGRDCGLKALPSHREGSGGNPGPHPHTPQTNTHPRPSRVSPQCSGSPAVPLSPGGAAPAFHLQRTTELCCQCRCSPKRPRVVLAAFASNPTAAREVINPIFNNPVPGGSEPALTTSAN